MEQQLLSPGLSRALHEVVYYDTARLGNEDIRAICTGLLKREAEEGEIATYLFDVLPQLEHVFDFITQARKELNQPVLKSQPHTGLYAPSFQSAIDWIVGLTSAVCIYRLGNTKKETESEDLIIVVPKKSDKKFSDYSRLINTVNFQGREIKYSLYKMSQLEKYMNEGSVFHFEACSEVHLIFYSGQEALPRPKVLDYEGMADKALLRFDNGYQRAMGFLNDTKFYIHEGRMEMAAFMLHQAAEQTLTSAIWAICALDIRNHSIVAMMAHCKRFVPDLHSLFPGGSVVEDGLIELVETVYQHARYKDGFVVSLAQVELLQERVTLLVDMVQCNVMGRIGALRTME